jgi:hypothetical protein
MYLNDVQRTSFYEGIGLNTRDFDMHVIVEVLIHPKYISLTAVCLLCEACKLR